MKITIKIERSVHSESVMDFMRKAVKLRAFCASSGVFDYIKTKGIKCEVSIIGRIIMSLDHIGNTVFEYFDLSWEKATQKNRKREFCLPRQIAMTISKRKTKKSLSDIAFKFGEYDHCTVLHSVKTVNNLLETDKKFRSQFEEIEKLLK